MSFISLIFQTRESLMGTTRLYTIEGPRVPQSSLMVSEWDNARKAFFSLLHGVNGPARQQATHSSPLVRPFRYHQTCECLRESTAQLMTALRAGGS